LPQENAMKLRTGIWIGAGVVVVALVSVPLLLPLDTYRGPIENAASSAIGRAVRIHGSMRLAVYPQLGLSLSDVTIANMPGSKDPQMVSIGSVLVGAELMPLLSRELKVTEVVLQKPVIHLEVAKDGTPNWRLATTAPTQAQTGANARPANAPTPPAAQSASRGFQFRTVSIDDGEFTYTDAQSGASEALHDVSIQATLQPGNPQNPLAAPLTVNGDLTYNSEKLKIDGKIDRFGALLNGLPTGLHLGIGSNIINADFTGSVNEDRISGALKMGAHSVRSFAAWAGHPMPPGNGFGLMAMEGQFSVQNGVYTLSHTHLAFDAMNMNTDISIDTNKEPLALKGMVSIDKLDVTPYLAPGKETDAIKAKPKGGVDKNAPLEFGWLKAANADLKLVLGGLVVPDLKLDQAIVTMALHDGVLKADLNNVTAYGGSGKGTLTLDASAATPSLHETLDLNGLKAQPFLDDLLGVDRIGGSAALKVDVTSRGTSKDAILRALNGKGSMKFSDGTITGVDLQAVARLLQSVLTAEVLTGAVGNNAKTAFGQMGGTFTVQNGVLKTTDFALESPAVEMSAKGTVDIPNKQIEFHFEPKAKKGIPGLKLVDIGVPFYAKGPWDNPNYGPDAGGIAKNVVDKLGQGAALPVDLLKNPGGTLKSLFGGGKDK
jgi:AsmA protein